MLKTFMKIMFRIATVFLLIVAFVVVSTMAAKSGVPLRCL